MPDSDEALGDDVEKEAFKEFQGWEGNEPLGARFAVVSRGEGDLIIDEADEAVIGDCHSVGVLAKVEEDLFGSAEGGF